MNLSMIIPLFIVALCLMTISYFVGDLVGTKRTTKKIQRFLESYSYAKSFGQFDTNDMPIKMKPRLFVLKNDDFKQK